MTQRQGQVNLLSINEFAQVCRTTPRTLRFYEKINLFKPAKTNPRTKYRLYESGQARQFLTIKLLQNFHIPLADIPKTLTRNTGYLLLNQKLTSLGEEISEKEKERRFLQKIQSLLYEKSDVGSRLKTQTFGPYVLFCMRVDHGAYDRITDYIKTLWYEAKKLKLDCTKSEITFYLDASYRPRNATLEIALICNMKSIPNGIADLPKNYYFRSYLKTHALVYAYIGPYEYLTLVYQKLYEFLRRQRITIVGSVFEKYTFGPLNVKSKYDYVTTIAFPIAQETQLNT